MLMVKRGRALLARQSYPQVLQRMHCFFLLLESTESCSFFLAEPESEREEEKYGESEAGSSEGGDLFRERIEACNRIEIEFFFGPRLELRGNTCNKIASKATATNYTKGVYLARFARFHDDGVLFVYRECRLPLDCLRVRDVSLSQKNQGCFLRRNEKNELGKDCECASDIARYLAEKVEDREGNSCSNLEFPKTKIVPGKFSKVFKFGN